MERKIESGEELYGWMQKATNQGFEPKYANKGVMVSTKVRQEVLTSIHQGRFISKGEVVDIKFENMQGGVWRAYVDFFYNLEKEKSDG